VTKSVNVYLATLCVVLIGCSEKEPEDVSSTSNPDIKLDLLFTHDGCRVYRFFDAGNYVYFAKCHTDEKDAKEKEK